ncbi:MAG TPA: hypothetical protein VGQ09_02570 [Chitinophagaceae bacterium]|nr:hypothetical protein [Chitinophagaceae bacterium]
MPQTIATNAQHSALPTRLPAGRNAGDRISFQLLEFYLTLAMRRDKINLWRRPTAGILIPALGNA